VRACVRACVRVTYVAVCICLCTEATQDQHTVIWLVFEDINSQHLPKPHINIALK